MVGLHYSKFDGQLETLFGSVGLDRKLFFELSKCHHNFGLRTGTHDFGEVSQILLQIWNPHGIRGRFWLCSVRYDTVLYMGFGKLEGVPHPHPFSSTIEHCGTHVILTKVCYFYQDRHANVKTLEHHLELKIALCSKQKSLATVRNLKPRVVSRRVHQHLNISTRNKIRTQRWISPPKKQFRTWYTLIERKLLVLGDNFHTTLMCLAGNHITFNVDRQHTFLRLNLMILEKNMRRSFFRRHNTTKQRTLIELFNSIEDDCAYQSEVTTHSCTLRPLLRRRKPYRCRNVRP